jgi:hypothetical protein
VYILNALLDVRLCSDDDEEYDILGRSGYYCCLLVAGIFLGLLLNPQDIEDMFLQYANGFPPNYTGIQPRRLHSLLHGFIVTVQRLLLNFAKFTSFVNLYFSSCCFMPSPI